MSEPSHLYMFAIMPPPDLSAKIHNERLNFAQEYNFVKALKPPVHITLFSPFKIPVTEATAFEKRMSSLKDWASRQAPFTIELNNFSYFDNSRSPVLFIDVVRSPQLVELHSSFVKEFKKYLEVEKQKDQYKPHITIGYRDIDPKVFADIKVAYSKRRFQASFYCNTFYLWKHNGQNWQVLMEYSLDCVKDQLSLF